MCKDSVSYNNVFPSYLQKMYPLKQITCFLIFCLFTSSSFAQDLEPRRWTPIPLDLQVVGVGYGYTSADILFDPVLLAEDAKMDSQVLGASYVRSIKIADKLVRFDVTLPWATAEWEGLLDGEPTKLNRTGLLDPKFRVSVNLLGTPALNAKKMRNFLGTQKINTVFGAALSVTVPLGEYNKEKLINLGENRYVIRPQVGLVHTRNNWSYELTGSVFFYTDNDDFYGGNKREQKPLYAIQSHLIYRFPKGKWASLSAGYGFGGQSKVNNVNKDDKRRTLLSALSFGMPVSQTQTIKVAYLYGQTNSNTGFDSDSFVFAWSKLF